MGEDGQSHRVLCHCQQGFKYNLVLVTLDKFEATKANFDLDFCIVLRITHLFGNCYSLKKKIMRVPLLIKMF